MPEKPSTFDPNLQTEDIAFTAAEMIACPNCDRQNPPNRLKCLYCAAELKIEPQGLADVRLNLRKLESWEKGFNVIICAGTEPNAAVAASLLGLTPSELGDITPTGSPMPVARVESEAEANIVKEKLGAYGFGCKVVSDADLNAEKPLTRLSRIDLDDETITLTDFNTHERREASVSDLAVIVTGAIATQRTDSLEKRKRGGKRKLLDETAVSHDEPLVDIYLRDDAKGFRVQMAGFDFSCLGAEMGLVAVENMRLLVQKLMDAAPNAKLVSDYDKVRHTLNGVWEPESRNDPLGIVRAGFGKKEFGSIATTNNLVQFTKYSRLQWHLL
jgi:hypothetical protein